MSLEITLYARGSNQGGKRKLDRHLLCTQCQHIGVVDGGGIAAVDIACNSISFFDFAFRIFIIFKPNICDFAAFRYTRSWGRTSSRGVRRGGYGVNRWGQLKLSMRRVEHVVVAVAALGALPTAERVVRKI